MQHWLKLTAAKKGATLPRLLPSAHTLLFLILIIYFLLQDDSDTSARGQVLAQRVHHRPPMRGGGFRPGGRGRNTGRRGFRPMGGHMFNGGFRQGGSFRGLRGRGRRGFHRGMMYGQGPAKVGSLDPYFAGQPFHKAEPEPAQAINVSGNMNSSTETNSQSSLNSQQATQPLVEPNYQPELQSTPAFKVTGDLNTSREINNGQEAHTNEESSVSQSTKKHVNPPEQKSVPTLDKTKDSYSLAELETVLKMDGVKCGTVPIYNNLYKRSINETFNPNPEDDEDGDFRILHGLDSVSGEWPWIVRLQFCQAVDNCATCTGTLLNNRWFITAGHCGAGKERLVEKYTATLGLYDLVSRDQGAFDMKLDKVIVHPDYKELTNDVMLARLAKPVQFNDFIQPACFVHATRNILRYTKNKKCYTVGYGLAENMEDALRLQKLEISAKEPSACNNDQLNSVQLKRGTVCVGPPDGKIGGSCKGDSGGPNLCYDPKRDAWILFGTVSYGPSDCDRESGDKWLTVSVDLSNYRRWILTSILKNS